MTHLRIVAILTGAAIAAAATPALAAQCNHKGGFPGFLTDFKKDAGKQGISKRGLDSRREPARRHSVPRSAPSRSGRPR